MSLEATSKFNIPGITPTWNASTWSSRWGHEVWMTFLDCPGHLWPEIASWPLHKKSFWLQGGVQNFKIMTWTQDLPQLRWFVPYININDPLWVIKINPILERRIMLWNGSFIWMKKLASLPGDYSGAHKKALAPPFLFSVSLNLQKGYLKFTWFF